MIKRGALWAALALATTSCMMSSDQGEELVEASSSAANAADGSFILGFLNESTMRGAQGDWDFCHGKASCAAGEAITGISRMTNGPGRSALCSPRGSAYSGNAGALLTLDGNNDNRQAQRTVDGKSDWAFGYYKLECASGQYVQGVSENAVQCQGNNRFHAIRCAHGQGLLDSGCSTRVFDWKDDRGYTGSGDWDYGAYKGECRQNEYLAGVSVHPGSGHLHSLLCCPASSGGPGGAPFYGMSPDHGTFDANQASTLKAMGTEIVRLQLCNWPSSEGYFRSLVDTARAQDLAVHVEINYCTLPGYSNGASWHAGFNDQPGQENAFAKAFIQAAGEIAAAFEGDVYVYEIWNEPNASPRPFGFPNPFWAEPGNSDWDGSCTSYAYGADYNQDSWALCPRQLGVITAGAFAAIRAADPGAKVVAGNVLYHGANGWVAKEYYKQLEASPAVSHFEQQHNRHPWDFFGYHPYGQRPDTGALGNELDAIDQIRSQRGDGTPLAITEYGWSTQSGGDPNVYAGESGQASILPAAFSVAEQHGVGFFIWFNYLDAPGLSMGIRRSNMTWKPAAKALCQATGASACPAP